MKVINIDSNTTVEQLQNIILDNSDCIFIHYTHANALASGENLIYEARKYENSYRLLIALANNGYYLYMTKGDKISSFVHHSELPTLWKPVSSGEYIYNEDGLVYSLTKSASPQLPTRNLLVIFSSMNRPIYTSSLMRGFTQNFSSIGKFISPDTAILRIADLGGVVGSYYMNSNYLSNNEDNIQKLIIKVQENLSANKVVLYGASKGGTAALLYSLYGGYDAVIVDPILSDEYYISKYNDLHFTRNIFPMTKQDKFAQVLRNQHWDQGVNRTLFSSIHSPQFSYINDILLDGYGHNFTVFNNLNSSIKDHPDVAPNSLHMITALLNLTLNRIVVENQYQEFI